MRTTRLPIKSLAIFGGTHHEDCSTVESILGPPYSWKQPNIKFEKFGGVVGIRQCLYLENKQRPSSF